MSECAECGEQKNVDEHHISYNPESTVPLCRSCHKKVHADESHPYYPDDRPEYTTIELDDDVREQLRDYTLPDETASDAVARMMDETDPPQYGIDAAEAERIAERVFEREVRR